MGDSHRESDRARVGDNVTYIVSVSTSGPGCYVTEIATP